MMMCQTFLFNLLRFSLILCACFFAANQMAVASADTEKSSSEKSSQIKNKVADISHLISKTDFLAYQNVADFIQQSPKVTVVASLDEQDKVMYGDKVLKTLTGTDCDRDGNMDDNATCNAVFFKLWLKYGR